MSYLKENLHEIQEKVAAAAKKSGRNAEDITLVAVTKTVPVEYIREAYDLGLRHFGENRVQEFLPKYGALGDGDIAIEPAWHMIGHLQTNKVRSIIGKVQLIHSVDSLRLAEEINKRALQHNLKADILIEINIAEEDTKQGVSAQNAILLIERIHHLPNVCIKGLMCIAPYVEISEQNRIYFEKMHKLFVDIQSRCLHNIDMHFLSMGMTGDYEVAIEEGANIIRIGTGLFRQK